MEQRNLKSKTKEADRQLKANVFLENPKWVLIGTLAAEVLLLLLINVLANTLLRFCQGHLSDCFSVSCLYTFPRIFWPMYFFLAVAGIGIAAVNIYRFRNAFRSLEAGQKGSSRFTTMEEIRQQYPAADELPRKDGEGKLVRIPGNGGLPVACQDGKMYLDETATNTLILAITRAGKGETIAIRMLDSYSRSELQPSLVILDMKFDLRKMCTKAFQDRGYKVMSINLENPMRGVGYNPLYLITRYYEEGRESDAELLCKAFAYPHFASSSGRSDDNTDFFLSNATSALTAAIMAHTVDCLRQDVRENAKLAGMYLRKRIAYERLEEGKKEQAREAYGKFLQEGKTFAYCVSHMDYLPDIPFEPSDHNAKKNNMASVLNMFTILAGQTAGKNKTRLDEYFDRRGMYDRARAVYGSINVSGDRTKGSIFSQMLTKLSQYTFGGMEQLTRESLFSPEELGFGKQPVALFLQVPFYDRSKDAIAISMIDQLYQANARACLQSKSGKCERRIVFHLDEVAQFPPIENLDSKLAICLGLNMVFNLIIQSDAQLNQKYGEAAKIIKGNCGNQVYLQTSEKETAEMFSSLLGSRTITNVNRVGTRFSLGKSYTETVEERSLLTPRELMDLQEGENVIIRAMYRRDLKGNKVVPHPIFNSERDGRAYRYRYQYLTEYFPDAETVTEEDLHLPRLEEVPPSEMMYDFECSFEASDFWTFRRELAKWKEKLMAGYRPGSEEALAYDQIARRFDELEKKQLYQWDQELKLPDADSPSFEKQFADLCGSLDQKYRTGILDLIQEGCSAGKLLIQITQNRKISLEEKNRFYLGLKSRLELGG